MTTAFSLTGTPFGVNCNLDIPDTPATATDCNQTQKAKFSYPAWTAGLDSFRNAVAPTEVTPGLLLISVAGTWVCAAAADWLTILVLFLLGRRLYGRWTGLLAAGFYAVAAFPLQQSHFWTVDTFTTLWVTLALYFAVRALDGASALRGAPSLAYLALWGGAVIWEAAYWHRPARGGGRAPSYQ